MGSTIAISSGSAHVTPRPTADAPPEPCPGSRAPSLRPAAACPPRRAAAHPIPSHPPGRSTPRCTHHPCRLACPVHLPRPLPRATREQRGARVAERESILAIARYLPSQQSIRQVREPSAFPFLFRFFILFGLVCCSWCGPLC